MTDTANNTTQDLPPQSPSSTPRSVWVVVQTSVAYNDGYNTPTSPDKFYLSREKAEQAAADENIAILGPSELIFPPLDSELAQEDTGVFYVPEDEEERQAIIDEAGKEFAHLSACRTRDELRKAVMALDIDKATHHGWEDDWYGVVELKVAQ